MADASTSSKYQVFNPATGELTRVFDHAPDAEMYAAVTAAYYFPAVLTGVTKDMRSYSEEFFGPVAVVYSVSSDEEALALANDTPYGLGGAVFCTEPERARRVAQRLEVGDVKRQLAVWRRCRDPLRWGQAQRLRPRARSAGQGRVRQRCDQVLRGRHTRVAPRPIVRRYNSRPLMARLAWWQTRLYRHIPNPRRM